MRSDRLRLQDMLDAIDVVAQYLPADRAAFDRDPPVQSHIYRHVMIVGEEAWSLSQPLKDANPHVPWKQIEGMRHIMVHDYFKVDWDIVYATARTHMPALRSQVKAQCCVRSRRRVDSDIAVGLEESATPRGTHAGFHQFSGIGSIPMSRDLINNLGRVV